MFFALFLYEILICEESLMLPSNFSEDSFCAGFSAERVGDSLGGTCPLRIFYYDTTEKEILLCK